MAADDARDIVIRLTPTADDAIPNAHSVTLDVLARLAAATGDDTWRARADALFAAVTPAVTAQPIGHAGILNALDLYLRGREIVAAGPERQALYEAALAAPFGTTHGARSRTRRHAAAGPSSASADRRGWHGGCFRLFGWRVRAAGS